MTLRHLQLFSAHSAAYSRPLGRSFGTPFTLKSGGYRGLLASALGLHGSQRMQQLLLKLLLNAHSTLVMGRMGLYQGNLMTSLSPSNNKLIDRAIRYSVYLGQQQNVYISYQQAAVHLFSLLPSLQPEESVVDKIINAAAISQDKQT